MKAKYIIASLAGILALAIGCTKETPSVLSEVQVSSSYIGLSNNEGTNSKTIQVTAVESWAISDCPEWLAVSPLTGSAGETEVKFSAEKADATRDCTIKLSCSGKTQIITVLQQAEKVTPKTMTVAEAIEFINQYPDGSPVSRVRGVVCKIQDISPAYGNATYYISDDGTFGDGNWLEVYRGLWMNGEPFTSGDEFTLGDELVIEGVLMSYKGTPETKEKEAYVIELNKSLIKCDSLVFDGAKLESLPIEGGEFEAILTCKGNGVSVVIPDDAKAWLSITGITTEGDKAVVSFLADFNEGGDRSSVLVFSTNDGEKDYTAQAEFAQKGAIIECTVAEFNLVEVGSTVYRLSGIVSIVDNAEKGRFHFKDFSGETYAYNVTNMAEYSSIKLGDIVTIIGTRDEYNGTIELTNGVIEDLKAVTPLTAAEVEALPKDDKDNPQNYFMLTGKVTNGSASGHKFDLQTYGNFDLVDDSGAAYVYGVSTGWKGETKQFGTLGVEEGDIITVVGYKDIYEDKSGNKTHEVIAMYFTHEKGVAPEPPAPTGNIVLTFPDDNSANNKFSGYTGEWTAKIGGQEFEITNFNNNSWNSWNFIKCGSKNDASTGSISTKIAAKVSKVIVTVDAITEADKVTSSKLLAGTAETALTLAVGTNEFAVAAPAENLTYSLEIACEKAAKNGVVTISKVEYVCE